MAKDTTQEQFARLANISQPRVSQLIRQGILSRGGTILDWTRELLEHQRRIIAQHESKSGIDLIAERARLSQRQAEKVEIENARLRNELLPVAIVKSILQSHNTTIRARLLGVPNRFKAKHPKVTTEEFLSLKDIVNEVLTELSRVRLPDDLEASARQYFRDLHSAAQSNGHGVGR
jgi:phage terminase Nu1 subunit (DNA packaging protein)